MEPRDCLTWSADCKTEDDLVGYLRQMGSKLRHVKIDELMVLKSGIAVISRVRDMGYDVFADAKISEIPTKSAGIAEEYLKHKPAMLNCMAGICSSGITNPTNEEERKKVDGLKRFADLCRSAGTRSCAVTVLTSKTPETVAREYNGRTSEEQVLVYAYMIMEAGFTDIVCSPHEAAILRKDSQFDALRVNTPGVRPAGVAVRDQARVGTIEGTLAAGSDNLIIGSAITDGDPVVNLDNLLVVIGQALYIKEMKNRIPAGQASPL